MRFRHIPERPIPGKRLGRHVNHDPRSRAFPFVPKAGTYTSAKHERHIPVLDQGDLGSCTGNACEGALGTSGLFDALPQAVRPSETDATADERAAVALYSAATELDDYAGAYPPNDSGSDGLSVAKAAKAMGLISGYLHAFSLDAALKALMEQPVIIGIDWYEGFDTPDANGLISITGQIRGGHELVLDEIDAEHKLVWLTNSWSESWGLNGRACMSFATLGDLLAKDGDCTILVPLTEPAPVPNPPEPNNPFPLSFLWHWLSALWHLLSGGR